MRNFALVTLASLFVFLFIPLAANATHLRPLTENDRVNDRLHDITVSYVDEIVFGGLGKYVQATEKRRSTETQWHRQGVLDHWTDNRIHETRARLERDYLGALQYGYSHGFDPKVVSGALYIGPFSQAEPREAAARLESRMDLLKEEIKKGHVKTYEEIARRLAGIVLGFVTSANEASRAEFAKDHYASWAKFWPFYYLSRDGVALGRAETTGYCAEALGGGVKPGSSGK